MTEQSTTTVATFDEFVASHLTEESYTPWAIIRVTNAALEALGVEKILPPQMGYNYAKNGLFAGKESKGRKSYTRTEVQAWMTKYLAKNAK